MSDSISRRIGSALIIGAISQIDLDELFNLIELAYFLMKREIPDNHFYMSF